jgi:uncharacterized protein (DUF1501 family)
MKNTRRDFLKSSALASAAFMMPRFLLAGLNNSTALRNGKKLVIIQFSGGNDGLNCLIPFSTDTYYELRPDIAIYRDEVLKLTPDAALNPNLSFLADLYHDGNLAIINTVGYPNPNRSHFRSMDIWQSGSGSEEYLSSGWIGRTLDSTCSDNCTMPHAAIELDDTLSLALKGEKLKGLAFRKPKMLYDSTRQPLIRKMAEDNPSPPTTDNAVDFLYKTLTDTVNSAEYLHSKAKIFSSGTVYPDDFFAKQMKQIAELIISGSETSVYYISLSGFDTHILQRGTHNRLLKLYSDTLTAFCSDLKTNNRFSETVILTFSEFGRRVAQNGGKGTDHGAANVIFLAGGGLKKAGMQNPIPDLGNLIDGDLKHTVDFRSVYSTVLQNWLNVDATQVLNGKFPLMEFV